MSNTEEHHDTRENLGIDLIGRTVWAVTVLEMDLEGNNTLAKTHQCVFDDEEGANGMIVGEILRAISMRLLQDHEEGPALYRALIEQRFDLALEHFNAMKIGVHITKLDHEIQRQRLGDYSITVEALEGMMQTHRE